MPIAFEFYAIAGRDKTVRQFLEEYFADYRHLLARLIERSELLGTDAEATAITLVALFEGHALLFFVGPRRPGGQGKQKHRCGCSSPDCNSPPLTRSSERHRCSLNTQVAREDRSLPTHRRPYGIYRWFANAPRWFYRLGLGWVLGYRVMQLTHRGRKTGQIRRTILEVLHYDPQTREVVVVSGWEGITDWYRNITHEPALEVRISWVVYQPTQELLAPDETARLIFALFARHPREVRFVGQILGIDPQAPEPVLRARLETFFRGVRFRPAHAR